MLMEFFFVGENLIFDKGENWEHSWLKPQIDFTLPGQIKPWYID